MSGEQNGEWCDVCCHAYTCCWGGIILSENSHNKLNYERAKMACFVLTFEQGIKYLVSKLTGGSIWRTSYAYNFIKLPHLPLDERINMFLRAQWLPAAVVDLLRGRCVLSRELSDSLNPPNCWLHPHI